MAVFDPSTFNFVNSQITAALTDQFEYEQALQRQKEALAQELGGYQFQLDQEQVGLNQALRNAQLRAQQASAQAGLVTFNAAGSAALNNQLAGQDADLANYLAAQRSALDNVFAREGVDLANYGAVGRADLANALAQREYGTAVAGQDMQRAQMLRQLGDNYHDAGSTFYGDYMRRGMLNSGVANEALRIMNERYRAQQGDVQAAYAQALRGYQDAVTGTREQGAFNVDLTGRQGALQASQTARQGDQNVDFTRRQGQLNVDQTTARGNLATSQAASAASLTAQNASQDADYASIAAREGYDLAAREIKRRQQVAQKQFEIWRDQALGSNQFRAGIRDQQAGQFFTNQAMTAAGDPYA